MMMRMMQEICGKQYSGKQYSRLRSRTLPSLLLFLQLTAGTVIAQSDQNSLSRSGSFYSGFAFGAPADIYSGHTVGIGLPGVSDPDGFKPNSTNPAHWGNARLSKGQIRFGLAGYRGEDSVNRETYSLFTIESFQVVLPLLRDRLGASVGFRPATRLEYSRTNSGIFEPGELVDPVGFITNSTGTGGVNVLEAGFGYRFNDYISVGYAPSIFLMALEKNSSTDFTQGQFQSKSITETISGHAAGHRFGAYIQTGSLLAERDRLQAGLSVQLPVTIRADLAKTTFRPVDGVFREVDIVGESGTTSSDVKIPLEVQFGITYYLNPANSVTTELQFQQWGNARFSSDLTQEAYFTDRFKTGLGYQFKPDRTRFGRSFFTRLQYRTGITYDSGHLTFAGSKIDTWMIHAGISVPSPNSPSSMDLSFHMGWQGTDSMNLVKEQIFKVKLSLNLAEFMFVRTRFQ
jgi:hypothetical protein